MPDPRIQALAHKIITYSVAIKPGEKLMINCTMDTIPLVKALIAETYKVGCVPFVNMMSEDLTGEINKCATQEQIEYLVEKEAWRSTEMDATINLNVVRNEYELNAAAKEHRAAIEKWTYQCKVKNGVLPTPLKTKWTVMLYPSYPTARAAKMPIEEYEDLYFNACLIDYGAMLQAMEKLQALMNKAEQVHILGPGTDLRFCIKDCPADISAGTWNMPDGEVLCVPKIDSANGYITYNIPSLQKILVFENVYLEFKDGVIVKATANYTDALNAILDCDEGARRIGEFALGTNPAINRPTGSILFDEKMAGTFHFTPGQQIARIGNGNTSQIHWDLVRSHLPEHGGGEIWFDDVLIQKDGKFTFAELECLNPVY